MLGQGLSPIDEHTAARLQTWRDSVHTRAGAASWVKHRCQQTCDHRLHLDWASGAALHPGEAPSHPAAWEALPLSPEISQTNTAEELATRWNAGLYRYPRKQPVAPQLSAIASDEVCPALVRPHRDPIVVPPLPPQCSGLDFWASTPFDEATILRWAPGMLTQFCPKGSPGLDGWTTRALRQLDPTSAGILCELFDQCDLGRFPRCLCQARVVGIAKMTAPRTAAPSPS